VYRQQKLKLFGLSIVNVSTRIALDALLTNEKSRITAAFLNAHCVNVARSDENYREALGKADLILPDGIGLELAARMAGGHFVENLNGTDLFAPLCREAARRGMSIYFLGGRPTVAAKAAARASALAEGLHVAGTRHGYFDADEEAEICAEVNASGASIVLVAMGVPRQETWIARNRHRLDAAVVMGVGGQFDFWSGRVPRAPAFMRALRLEWAWRLAMEPRRLARRYLVGNIQFLLHAFRQRHVHRLALPSAPQARPAHEGAHPLRA
jgi:exopolysaccharide biosynthesis WecB/TagA/CpsF family protein